MANPQTEENPLAINSMDNTKLSVILVSPNVSEQMGGEAIKALQIYLELKRQGVWVHQITHERVKAELESRFPDMQVSFVKDTNLQKGLNRIAPLAPLLNVVFLWRARQLAQTILKDRPDAVVHFNAPVSPVLPYFRVPGASVVIGPLNGNVHYPPAFRTQEPLSYRLRRWLHPILQFLNRFTMQGKQHAGALLVSGGERTYQSLRMCGCRDEQFVDSVDSGVLDRLYANPRITHTGTNIRFFQNGRLVRHKGTGLVIRALKQTKNKIEFDIIGRGPELVTLRALTAALDLEDRVHFIEWIPDHSKVAEMLRQYRAFVFPSLAEANGIVVQEAMAQGLPVIALDWGGPSLLVTPETGVLIEPKSEEHVIRELAKAMDRLSEDGGLAERMSIAGRQRAFDEGYLWSGLVEKWVSVYLRVREARAVEAQPAREKR
jgi:glycosyltransferase involved in cell wall biosynthesis